MNPATTIVITASTAFGWGVINHGNAKNLKLGTPSTAAAYGAVAPILFALISNITQQFIGITNDQAVLKTSRWIVTGIVTHLGARKIAYKLTGENISVKNAAMLTGIDIAATIAFMAVIASSRKN